MTRLFVLAAAVLALFGLALLVRLPFAPPRTSVASQPTLPAAAEPEPAAFPPPPATTAAAKRHATPSVLPRLDAIHAQIVAQRKRAEAHRQTGAPYTEEELSEVMAVEREIEEFGRELAREIREHPERGASTLEAILALRDDEASRRLAEFIAPALDDTLRSRLTRALQLGGSVREREVACIVLARDPGPVGLAALLSTAQSDESSGVRRLAFAALGERVHDSRSAAEHDLIRQVARRRSSEDPDETVRTQASAAAAGPGSVDPVQVKPGR